MSIYALKTTSLSSWNANTWLSKYSTESLTEYFYIFIIIINLFHVGNGSIAPLGFLWLLIMISFWFLPYCPWILYKFSGFFIFPIMHTAIYLPKLVFFNYKKWHVLQEDSWHHETISRDSCIKIKFVEDWRQVFKRQSSGDHGFFGKNQISV